MGRMQLKIYIQSMKYEDQKYLSDQYGISSQLQDEIGKSSVYTHDI